MDDKCFCHLNGYACKDAEAHKRIEALEKQLGITPAESEGDSDER